MLTFNTLIVTIWKIAKGRWTKWQWILILWLGEPFCPFAIDVIYLSELTGISVYFRRCHNFLLGVTIAMNTTIKKVKKKKKDTLANLLEKYNYEFSQYDKRQFNSNGLFGYKYLNDCSGYFRNYFVFVPFLIWTPIFKLVSTVCIISPRF